jgi:hypothetical protein
MEDIQPPTPAGIDPLQGPSSVIEDRHVEETSA